MRRSAGLVVAVLVATLSLAGCAVREPPVASSKASPVVTSNTASPSSGLEQLADLRGLCAHVREAFQSATTSDREMDRGLHAELLGMSEVSGPAAKKALAPLLTALAAFLRGKGDTESTAEHDAINVGFEHLRATCVAAGSTAW